MCLSVLKDLTYKYSLRVGDRAPRTLYQGTDYQYYFSLPAGDPSDDYGGTAPLSLSVSWLSLTCSHPDNVHALVRDRVCLSSVTVSTEIRSGAYDTVTKACSVSVQVLPSFSGEAPASPLDPDLQL